ncbi:uncharacterized protein KGF55_004829 [Candida pseudojiufengensis]|uniref:uncharacterized protein n=1 Tax=Candida pseudojiufengensis TaxID=497109 RepID=UPI002224A713|nr:uncharacterized protein KGF55_004829 [Candida pseudojiufengensis]KAI5960106.1 hypothetical protein KGF55_004829 [Candida pseudojiufengensis]
MFHTTKTNNPYLRSSSTMYDNNDNNKSSHNIFTESYHNQNPDATNINNSKEIENRQLNYYYQNHHLFNQSSSSSLSSSTLESQPELTNQKRLFSWLFCKNVPPIPNENERKDYPWHITNPLNRMGFWWLYSVLKIGYKRTLDPSDLFKLTPELKVEYMYDKFINNLNPIISKDQYNWPKYAIPYALFLTFKKQYIFSCICLALAFVCISCSPLITRQIIDFVQYKYFGVYTTYNRGIGLTIGSVILIFINGLLLNHFFHNAMICGAQSKAILTKALLMKSFKLNNDSRYKFPVGKITSLMSTDLSRIDLAIGFQPLICCFPIPVIISIVILIKNMGVAALAGIGLFIISLFICVILTSVLFKTREKVVKYTDERVSLMREILNNLKIIKFYAWEKAYKLAISKIRNKEMNHLFTIKVLRNFITAYAVTLPVLTSMISFITMWGTNNMKSPGEVFSSLSLYAILAQAIMLLPIALATGADALIGFQRCNEFLSAQEFNEELNQILINPKNQYYFKNEDIAIKVSHADFYWENHHTISSKEEEKENWDSDTYDMDSTTTQGSSLGLSDVNITIKNKELVIITGPIGSGKTTLLNALAGFIKLSQGSIEKSVEILLCSSPWIQNATIKENIIFGKPFNLKKYKQVLYACALEDDISMLPAGDRTEIGERGITLSGGQKARINLARACYTDADCLLFDDVISAVDSKVARHIVNHLFKGLLRDKTIILATHQLSILDFADKVVFVNNGSVDVGTVNDLMIDNKDFRKLIEHGGDSQGTVKKSSLEEDDQDLSDLNSFNQSTQHLEKLDSSITGRTTSDEERATNAISWSIYKKYIELGSGKLGKFAIPIFLIFVIIATFCQVFTNTWLSFWMEKKFNNKTDSFYIIFYIIFAFLTVIFTAIEFSILAYMQDCSSNFLNLKAVNKILHTPMSYMDITPLGRILNRFTKDTDSLDNELGEQMRLFIFPLALIIGIIILCSCYLPYFIIAVPFLIFAFIFLANFYQGSSREIKRLESTQRSLVYNNFNETLTGMLTIKSFKVEQDFITKNDYFINKMNEAYYLSIATQRWLCVHLDMITSCFALIICLLCITGQFNISASSTGLLLNYVIQLVGVLSLTIRSMTSVENEMNSVERLYDYAFNLPQESSYEIDENKSPQNWPSSGYITFKNVYMKYRSNTPLILKNLNINFYPGEKIGICGRTGAGKSSIMNVLYRITELESGKIEIDGIDISKLGLYDLRSKLSIIPQEPVLFQGTIRKNLDPFNEHLDGTLWKALYRSGLLSEDQFFQQQQLNSQEISKNFKFHLDQIVDDEGNNFSLGEKQLITLARALVRNSKILILDEASSSVDLSTDLMIQKTIKSEFKNCTVICIAHRLKTLLNYDRIIVMDNGEIIEKGEPFKLFNKKDGIFRSMCDKANINENDF